MRKKISRRDFVRIGTQSVVGGIVLYTIPALLADFTTATANSSSYDWEKHYWGFVCDNEKCIGCGRCVVACKLENKVPWEPEYNRTWVERYVFTEEGETFVDSPNAGRDGFKTEQPHPNVLKSFFVPKLCNQCDNPPCVTVCPVGATYMTEDGVILIDQEHCIGCGYCLQACPYGARFFLPDKRVVDKCNWCYHRITKGILPACVEACPVKARVFGDLWDPESPVAKTLAAKRVYVLKPDLGTEPKVYYIGFEKGVH